jgi:glucosamine--fructose-6-phosphate aminotransferase (isomerizing)
MTFPMFDNILNQRESLRLVAAHQLGPGRDALVGAASLLRKSRHIVVSGMGASFFASLPLRYWLAEDAGLISMVETSELLHFLTPALDDRTTVVLVSRSGESVEITKLLPILRERGVPVIGVVNVPGSALAQQAGTVLFVNSPADELVAVQTYTGTVLTLSILAAAICNRLEQAAQEVKILLRLLPGYFESCHRALKTLDLTKSAPIYFLGRGSSLASVHESVLLMHETAKQPAVGMSAAHFRHGPVEAVSAGFRAVVFGTESKTREIDHALAADLKKMGADVWWIGPETGHQAAGSGQFWSEEIPNRFAPALEVVPVQMIAYRIAEANGIRPGAFRFATPITLTESGFSTASIS